MNFPVAIWSARATSLGLTPRSTLPRGGWDEVPRALGACEGESSSEPEELSVVSPSSGLLGRRLE